MNDAGLTPYKGLIPFQDSDADVRFFFGREKEREVIEANLMASRLTIVYGEPGVGKSSILRAGIAHHLRAVAAANLEARGEPGLAIVVFDEWRDDPVSGLRRAVAEAATQALGGSVRPDEHGSSLTDAFGLWQQLLGGDLYVILDQTEEYFLYHDAEGGPGTFADEFPEVVGSPELRVNFLLAIREDALAKVDVFRRRIPGVLDNYLRLDHLDRGAARDAIVEPITAYNRLVGEADAVSIEPALVDAVLEQVVTGRVDVGVAGRGSIDSDGGTVRIETPYLQLVMRRIWDAEREAGSPVLRLETLSRLGGAEQIVGDHVELALAGLTADEKDVAARLFDHLVTPSGTKIAHETADLALYAGTSEAVVLPVLAKLGHERILRSVSGGDGHGSRYEIFHDVLAEPVLAWKGRHEQARALETAAVTARRRHRRLAGIAAAALLALVILAGLTIFAFSEQSHAAARERTAKSRELAASALTEIGTDPELAVVLAAEAARMQDSPTADAVLRTALLASRVRLTRTVGSRVTAVSVDPNGHIVAATPTSGVIMNNRLQVLRRIHPPGRFLGVHGDDAEYLTPRGLELRRLADGSLDQLIPLRAGADLEIHNYHSGNVVRHVRMPIHVKLAAAGPRGTLLAVSDGGKRVVVIDALTGDARYELAQRSDVTSIAFGPGAHLLATGGTDGTVTLWSLATGRERNVLRGHVGPVRDVAFSPRATLLASASKDGTARVFRISDGAPLAVMSGHSNPVTTVAFSPDGTRIVTASDDGTARVWKAETGEQLAELLGHRGPVTAARFDGNSDVVTGGADGSVRLWYVLKEPLLGLVARLHGPVTRAFFVGPDRVEAVTKDGIGHLFDLSGRRVGSRAAAPPGPVRSSTGAVAAPAGSTVTIHEPDGHDVVLRGHTRPVTSVEFSPDGNLVVTGSKDRTARIWDAHTGALLHTLSRHSGTVGDASFSPDGQWVVTAGPTTAGLWSTDTGELVLLLRGHQGALTSASFNAAGDTIVTSGVDGTVRDYRCDICRDGQALIGIAARRLARTRRVLKPAEKAQFSP
jgi:WD40 repeat protein